MEISISTPALLFPTISLLMLAYTNRFLALTSAVRKLLEQYQQNHQTGLLQQIHALRFRISLIKYMQTIGVSSLFLCVLCMAALFAGWTLAANAIFAGSLALMLVSLGLSAWEVQLSANALDLALREIEADLRQSRN
jgi:predicted phage tail protein